MMAALPVPRSSSEVVKPSELFLDLMMLDPLKDSLKGVKESKEPKEPIKTKDVSDTKTTEVTAFRRWVLPSPEPTKATASPQKPFSAPKPESPTLQAPSKPAAPLAAPAAPPTQKTMDAAKQMALNATAAAAAVPLRQPCFSIPEGPRTGDVGDGGPLFLN
eukprot:g9121.t1